MLVLDFVTRLFEQAQRFAQIVAHRAGIAVDRIGIGLLEQVGWKLDAHGFEQFELAAGRHAGGGKVGAVEIAVDALICAEENLLVHFLEIERMIEGQPHPRVLEFRLPNVEGERLHQAEIPDGKFLEQDAFIGDRREIVGGGPVLGEILDPPVHRIGLEGLERHGGVTEIFEMQFVEIVAPDIDADARCPNCP